MVTSGAAAELRLTAGGRLMSSPACGQASLGDLWIPSQGLWPAVMLVTGGGALVGARTCIPGGTRAGTVNGNA